MAYDNEKKKYSKEHLWYVEIEVNGTIYRFCENRSPLPAGLIANPSLQSVRVNPAEIDLEGGIGVRAKCSISLMESDDYTEWGTIKNPVRFWSRWRAENPFYLGKRISIFSGYIVNNIFSVDNFTRRDYIIESFGQRGSGVNITGKDPLKLASNDRSKAPRESRGSLIADIDETATTFNLQPAGIGDLEYPTSNGIVRIGDEVMLYTARTGDSISGITRGAFNTEISDHSENDTVQLCLEYNSQTVSDIDYDLLVNYANVDPIYINAAEWGANANNAFRTTYSVLITEPTGVQDLLKEFAQSAPHYLYWDERVNQIRFSALQPPPTDAPTLTYEGNFIEGSTAVKDMQDMRVSTVICNYGIINPTKDLDEASNYRASYIREDSDSVTNYGQRAYKKINSRWIRSENKTAAVLMAARIGRRFSEAPRMLSFELDAKDSDVWTGDSVKCQTDLIEQSGGGFPTLFYQVLTAGESQNFNYTALEHTYGDAVAGDEDVEDPNVVPVFISGLQDQLKDPDTGQPRTLREYYLAGNFPTIEPQLDIRFIFESNAVAGSSDAAEYAVKTGSWPELNTPIRIQNNGLIVGRGGKGGNTVSGAPTSGGPAILLQDNIRLQNFGIVGGGGGGGAAVTIGGASAAGGGGAGYFVGEGGTGTGYSPPSAETGFSPAQDGTYTQGGDGGLSSGGGTEPETVNGGDGGDLGQAGGIGGAAAGAAIDGNGFTVLYEFEGDIFGTKAPAAPEPLWQATNNIVDASAESTTLRGVSSFGGVIYVLSNADAKVYRYDANTYLFDGFSASIPQGVFFYDLYYESGVATRWVSIDGNKIIELNGSWLATGNEILTSSTPRGVCKIGSNYYVVEGPNLVVYDSSYAATGTSFAHGLGTVAGLDTDGARIFYVEASGDVYSGTTTGAADRFEISTGLSATGVYVSSSIMLVSDNDSVYEYIKL